MRHQGIKFKALIFNKKSKEIIESLHILFDAKKVGHSLEFWIKKN